MFIGNIIDIFMKKWLITLCLTFIVLISMQYVSIKWDKDSIYKADIPETMRVAHIKNVNGKDFYKNIYVNKQKVDTNLGEHDVLIQVKSASLTSRDFEFFKNHQNVKEFVPCSDFSGKVVKVGSAVKDYEIGDPVFGITDLKNAGACADYVKVPENNINDIPYSLSYKQAASIPTPALLNWFAVHNIEKKGLKKGKVLIDDAISETGIMLTGLLVRSGFEVSAIDDERVRSWVENYGVKEFVSYEKFKDKKKELEGKFDVVINLKNGLHSKDLVSLSKQGGTFIAFEDPSTTRSDIRMLIIDNKKIDNEIFAKMARLVHLGKIQINVVKEFGLEHIRDAYMLAEKGNNDGKVVLNINK